MLILSGDGGDGRSGVMTGDRYHRNALHTGGVADFLLQQPHFGSGLDNRAKDAGINPKTLQQAPVEVPGPRVDKTRGGGVSVFADPLPCQEVGHEVGHE